MKLMGFFVVTTIALAGTAHAALNWVSTGPGGGGAFSQPSVGADGSIIVPSDLGGVYRSVDSGASWTAVGLNKGLKTTHVDAVAFHPSIAGTAFLGGENGIYRSTTCSATGACTWSATPVTQFVTSIGTASSGTATATTIYAATRDSWCLYGNGPKIWKSTDNGVTWSLPSAANGLPANANISAIRVQPGNPNVLIALAAEGRFSSCDSPAKPASLNNGYLSTNGGQTFTQIWIPSTVSTLLQSDGTPYIEDMRFDKLNASKVWASIGPVHVADYWNQNGELWLSSGSTGVAQDFNWQSLEHHGILWPLSNGNVRAINPDTQHPWDVNGTEFGVWEWSSTVFSWTHKTTAANFNAWPSGAWAAGYGGSLNGPLYTFLPVNDTTLWWEDGQFVYKTADSGATFVQQYTNGTGTPTTWVSRKIDNAVGGVLVRSPANAAYLYAGYFDMGCWLSSTATAAIPRWLDCNGPKSGVSNNWAASPWNGSWGGFGGNTTAIAPDPSTATTVWAVHSEVFNDTGPYKIAKSTNSGATWTDNTYNLPTLAASSAVTDLIVEAPTSTTRRLWAVANNRLYKLENGATAWSQVTTPCDGGLMVVGKSGTVMLAGGAKGICYSSNSGSSWLLSNLGQLGTTVTKTWWDGSFTGISDFAFNPTNSSIAWAVRRYPSGTANASAGLWKTTNGGATWTQVTAFGTPALARNYVRSVAVSPANANIIVVGASTGLMAGGYSSGSESYSGAWVSRDGGATWALENTGLAWPFMTRVRFTGGTTPRLYGVSPGQGIVYSTTSP